MEKFNHSQTLVRTGSAPRTICFSNSSTLRKFDYQNPLLNNKDYVRAEMPVKKPCVTFNKQSAPLTGDELQLRKVKLLQRSNTNRCIQPNLAPEEKVVQKKLLNNYDQNSLYPPGNFNTILNRTDQEKSITKCQKSTNQKMYRSFNLYTENNDLSSSKVKVSRPAQFRIYTTTTQIEHLPGGVKRNSNEIKDNASLVIKRNYSSNIKLVNDYQSKVTCLPGQQKNLSEPQSRHKKYIQNIPKFSNNSRNDVNRGTHNIISNEPNFETANQSTIRFSSKKRDFDKNTFRNSYQEKNLISNSKSKRPDFIKNPFESQISIFS